MLFRAGFVRFCFNLQLRPYGGQGGNKPATESKKGNQAQADKDRTRGTESKSHGHEQCSIRYDCQGGNKPATESKKDSQAQTGKKKTIVAEKSKEARAESKKINIESEFAFILWEKGAVKFWLPICREKSELFVLGQANGLLRGIYVKRG